MWRRLSCTLLVLLFVAAIATGIKGLFFNKIAKPGDPPPCFSREQAKKKGVWVCDVSVEPNTFPAGEKVYRLGEAWVEEAVDDDYFLVWFPRHNKVGWNWLCLRVPRYDEGVIELDKFKTSYAGHDFQYVMKLEVGDYPKVECQVGFQHWKPDKKTDLGIAILTPMLGQK
jgi:hypothetical protein